MRFCFLFLKKFISSYFHTFAEKIWYKIHPFESIKKQSLISVNLEGVKNMAQLNFIFFLIKNLNTLDKAAAWINLVSSNT